MAEKKKSGKKNRKFSRKAKKPSQQRYTSEKRWEKNKKRKAQSRANKTNKSIRVKIDGNWILISPIR